MTDYDPVFGTVRRLCRSARFDQQSRKVVAKTEPEVDTNVVRLGDVEGFKNLLAIQTVLKAQVSALKKHCYFMPEGFEETVRTLWLKYVTASGLEYSEEYLDKSDSKEELMFIERPPLTEKYSEIYTRNPYRQRVRLSITLPLLYFACLYCKVPLMLCELWQWAARGIIPYVSAIQCLSEQQLNDLDVGTRTRFHLARLPSMVSLHKTCGRLAGYLACYQHCSLPVVEPIVVVWKGLDFLGMPMETFTIVMRLLKELDTKIDYQVYKFERTRTLLPEASIMATIVFLIQLMYGLRTYIPLENPNSSRKKYYLNITQPGFPYYESLLNFWEKRLAQLKSDYVYNGRSVLYWHDLDRFVDDHKHRLIVEDTVFIRQIIQDFPDLAEAVDQVQMPFGDIGRLPSKPEAIQNPHRAKEIRITRPPSVSMAYKFLTYGRKFRPELFHKPFRTLLELAALSIGLNIKSFYKIYYSLFGV